MYCKALEMSAHPLVRKTVRIPAFLNAYLRIRGWLEYRRGDRLQLNTKHINYNVESL